MVRFDTTRALGASESTPATDLPAGGARGFRLLIFCCALALLNSRAVSGNICDGVPQKQRTGPGVTFHLPLIGSIGWVNGRSGVVPFEWGVGLMPSFGFGDRFVVGADARYFYRNPGDGLFAGPSLSYAVWNLEALPMVTALTLRARTSYLFGSDNVRFIAAGIECSIGGLLQGSIEHGWGSGNSGGEGFSVLNEGLDLAVLLCDEPAGASKPSAANDTIVRSYYALLTTHARDELSLALHGQSEEIRSNLRQLDVDASNVDGLRTILKSAGLEAVLTALDSAVRKTKEDVSIPGGGLVMPSPIDDRKELRSVLDGWCSVLSRH